MVVNMNEGWKCPGCSNIYAPFVRSCACQCVPCDMTTIKPTQGVGSILTAEQEKQQAEMNRKAQDKALEDWMIYGHGCVKVEHVPAQNTRPSWLPEGQENC